MPADVAVPVGDELEGLEGGLRHVGGEKVCRPLVELGGVEEIAPGNGAIFGPKQRFNTEVGGVRGRIEQ